jgi:hypothetical protein
MTLSILYSATAGIIRSEEKDTFGEITLQLQLFPTNISRGLAWERNWTSMVTGHHLTAHDMVRSSSVADTDELNV